MGGLHNNGHSVADLARRAGEVLTAQDAARAQLAPNGKDLERVLIALHAASAEAQSAARASLAKVRAELYKRLQDGQTLEIHGNEVTVSVVSNRDLIGLGMLDSDSVKVEAMAQRSYDVHRMAANAGAPTSGSIEDFIDKLEQEEQTETAGGDVEPDW
jgi:hypothetical protein